MVCKQARCNTTLQTDVELLRDRGINERDSIRFDQPTPMPGFCGERRRFIWNVKRPS